jgi:hypothetical protein
VVLVPHLSLFDPAGHDLTASLTAGIAIAASCNTRRSGRHLADGALLADDALIHQNLERLLLYTDGVLEARTADGDLFGLHRIPRQRSAHTWTAGH